MKSLELFLLVGEIDPELIFRAEAPVPFYKKPRMRVLAVAVALAVLLAVSTVMGSFLLVQRTEKYVRDNYPAYDGTPLHAVQILLTEDENIISSLLDEGERKLLGDAFAALRQGLKKGNGNEGDVTIGSEEQTTEPNENQTDQEQQSQTEPRPEETYEPPVDGWSEGLEYTSVLYEGEWVYAVSGIGTCTDRQLNIPPVYQGSPVIAILGNAFANCESITAVTLPPSIVEIKKGAFHDCLRLEQVTLSENLVRMAEESFMNCVTLKRIVIPQGIKTIEARTFAYCYQLSAVEFLGEPERICEYAFAYCTAWEYPVFPDSVQVIEPNALANSEMTHFVVPSGVTVLESYTFSECRSLVSVSLNGVTEIQDEAFLGCDALQTVYFKGNQKTWERAKMSDKTRELLTPLLRFHG